MPVPFYQEYFEVTPDRVHLAPPEILSGDSIGLEISMQIELPSEPPSKGYYTAVQLVKDRRRGWKKRLLALLTFHRGRAGGWRLRLSHFLSDGNRPEHVYQDLDIQGSSVVNLWVKVTNNGVTATAFDVEGDERAKVSASYVTRIFGQRLFLLFGNPPDDDKNSIEWPAGVRYAHLQLEDLRLGETYVGPRFWQPLESPESPELPDSPETPGELIEGFPLLQVREEVVLAAGALASGKDPKEAAFIAVRTLAQLEKTGD